jgi:hypothetical protein
MEILGCVAPFPVKKKQVWTHFLHVIVTFTPLGVKALIRRSHAVGYLSAAEIGNDISDAGERGCC